MCKERGGIAPFIFLVSLLSFSTIMNPGAPVVAFAAERKLLLQKVHPFRVGSYKPNDDIKMRTNQKNGSQRTPPPPPTINPPQQPQLKTWCIAKPSTSQEKLDDIINYCCTQPKVDCEVIKPGGICYFPPNKVSDASVVMNIFYKLNGKHPFDCYFKGSGLIATADPSVGKCIYRA